jgi:hypothetical protein
VGKGNQALVHVAFVPISRDEGKDFWGNPIDGCNVVLDRLNQAKDFDCALLKAVDLQCEGYTHVSLTIFRFVCFSFTSDGSDILQDSDLSTEP